MSKISFPYEVSALRVDQPLGTFYVAALPVNLLLEVAASDNASAKINTDGIGYTLSGAQRVSQKKRIIEIADYIDRVDSAFPNSIILAANHDPDSGFDKGESEDILEEKGANIEESKAWRVEEVSTGKEGAETETTKLYKLVIPTSEKLAAIIDGQHRLFAFTEIKNNERLNVELPCSIYIDLPKAFQAQIFATINSTQKRVDRSLTYELFGYSISEEDEQYWSPDKLAVFLTRKLATDVDSPLCGKIKVAPKHDETLEELASDADWQVSTAVIVDGILRLITNKPTRDSNAMRKKSKKKHRNVLPVNNTGRSPMRNEYIEGNDALIYETVSHYLTACKNVFWDKATPGSSIRKTIGIQAIFDILRKIVPECLENQDVSVDFFTSIIGKAGKIDFSTEEYINFSGSGRTVIRKAIEDVIGLS